MQLSGTTTWPTVLIDSNKGCRAPVGDKNASGTFGIYEDMKIEMIQTMLGVLE